jgi:phosphomevalonate kinase
VNHVRLSAPGKAVIAGEYAVLSGSPALAMAIDRRAIVDVADSGEEFHSIETPGLAAGRWRFTTGDGPGVVEWLDTPPAGVEAIASALFEEPGLRPTSGLRLSVDTQQFFESASGHKLGLGSSAAAVAGLVAALAQLYAAEVSIIDTAHRVHRRLQGGHGSGIDVATAVCGGLIEYRRDKAAEPVPREWPPALQYVFFWSGQPADTVGRIRGLPEDAFSSGVGKELARSADAIATAWASQVDLLETLRAFAERLQRFSVHYSLGIYDAGHDRVAGLAADCGVFYKPCGAGGGDIGIAIADDRDALGRLLPAAQNAGFMPLSLAMDSRGIVVEK